MEPTRHTLSASGAAAVQLVLQDWRTNHKVRKLWEESEWLNLMREQLAEAHQSDMFGPEILKLAFRQISAFPATATGVDMPRFLEPANRMAEACKTETDNPGLLLGAILASQVREGRDKVTLVVSPGILGFGAGIGYALSHTLGHVLTVIHREELVAPGYYRDDRLFCYLRLEQGADPAEDRLLAALAAEGHPVVRIPVKDAYHWGQEMVRWQFAQEVARSILGDAPEVAQALSPEAETLWSVEQGIEVFTPAKGLNLVETLHHHLNGLKPGGYFGIHAYFEKTLPYEVTLQMVRTRVMKAKKVSTGVGFWRGIWSAVPAGSALLHLTWRESPATHAQALAALRARGHSVLHLHITENIRSGLNAVASSIGAALQ